MPYIAVRMGHNMAYQIDMTSTYKAKGYLYIYEEKLEKCLMSSIQTQKYFFNVDLPFIREVHS